MSMHLANSPFDSAVIRNARNLFDIPREITYFNCANMAPQLRAVTAAGIQAVRERVSPWKLSASDWFSGAERLRSLAAQVFGTGVDGIALIPAVSYGIATAAANLPVSRNQSIILLDKEFPSNVYAWRELAHKKGARIVTVKRSDGESWADAVENAISEDTAIVALPQSHWIDGSKIDLERVADRVRRHGTALVIDASQSLGACSLDIERVQPDFLVSVGYKWLLGPYGLGYMYVAPKWQSAGTPFEQSWLTRAGSEDFTRLVDYRHEYRQGARRFDMGEFPQFLLVPMATVALRQILAWGITKIQGALSMLTATIVQGAAEIGFRVLPAQDRCGHMIGIRHPEGIPPDFAVRFREANVFVSFRGDTIRIAPHLYNDQTDLERLFEILQAVH